jgi:branched-subunit amino acid transport protein
MIEFLETHNLTGIAIGLCTFLIIGIFHPLVIKGEYYFGVKIWRVFLIAGLLCEFFAWYVDSLFWSIILGVTGFSALWGIGEIFQQQAKAGSRATRAANTLSTILTNYNASTRMNCAQ